MQGNSSIVGAILVFRIHVIRRVATCPDFQPMCPASQHDPRRDVYVPIFWSKKLIVPVAYNTDRRLRDSGRPIMDRSSKKY